MKGKRASAAGSSMTQCSDGNFKIESDGFLKFETRCGGSHQAP
jgi:hypothetical protein